MKPRLTIDGHTKGDIVYAVYDKYGGTELRTATVLSVSQKYIQLKWEHGDAFGGRRNVKWDDPCMAKTPEEAYRRAIARQTEDYRIAELQECLDALMANA
jgi:hypothetical protein